MLGEVVSESTSLKEAFMSQLTTRNLTPTRLAGAFQDQTHQKQACWANKPQDQFLWYSDIYVFHAAGMG